MQHKEVKSENLASLLSTNRAVPFAPLTSSTRDLGLSIGPSAVHVIGADLSSLSRVGLEDGHFFRGALHTTPYFLAMENGVDLIVGSIAEHHLGALVGHLTTRDPSIQVHHMNVSVEGPTITFTHPPTNMRVGANGMGLVTVWSLPSAPVEEQGQGE